MLYGRQPVLEVLRAGRRRVRRVILRRGSKPSEELDSVRSLATDADAHVEEADHVWFSRLGADMNHQGAVAEVEGYPYATIENILDAASGGKESPFLLLLDHVQDPQNLGSLLRSAEAAGVHGVLIPADRAAHVTPAAVRASAGASEHMQVAIVTNLARAMRQLRDEQNIWLYGLESAEGAVPYTSADFRTATGIVVGSEGEGLGRLIRDTCDQLIAIPLLGKIGSLNAGIAGAIALYEVRRQRTK
jgi:23S rRNA (guanosine2251-2'-O)-methyltransferase